MTDAKPTPPKGGKEPGKAASGNDARTGVVARARRSTKSVVGAIALLAGAASIAAFGGLWLQMAQGNDPVLGAKAEPVQPRVIKKIVVVEKVVPATSYGSSGSSYGYSGSSGSVSSGGSTSAAPVAVAPAPVVSSPT